MSLESMKRRIRYEGGATQQHRMMKQKWKSMLSATKNSYQAATFLKYPEMNCGISGLFNPIAQNLDYDTKMISVGFDSHIKAGDVFFWDNTKTFWICYSQDLTELAYFRGKCRRCDYKVKWVNKDKKVLEAYISVIGPNIADFRTHSPGGNVSVDMPTADLTVLVSNNEQNRLYFNQYQSFVLKGKNYKIHQVDDLSLPGVLQLFCQQSTNNLIEDDVENDIKNAWNIQPVVPQFPTQVGIEGPTSIKPLFPFTFSAVRNGGHWFVLENQHIKNEKDLLPVKLKDDELSSEKITVEWTSPNSGSFTLCYAVDRDRTLYKKYIIVESLM